MVKLDKRKAEKIFNKLLKEAKKDKDILGFFLSGSRGKGLSTKHSDYDTIMIVKDGKSEYYKEKYNYIEKIRYIDVYVQSFFEFKKHAYFGGPEEWNRYSFAHIKALVDKNKKIQRLIDEKGKIPKDKIKDFVSGHLDGYINYVYRSIKCFRDNNTIGARLEAAYSIPFFFNVIFAVHDGRLRPYYKYLEWELKNYPLTKFPRKSETIIENILKILETADIKIQQAMLKATEKVLRKEGYGKVFDNWGKSLDWMKKFKD